MTNIKYEIKKKTLIDSVSKLKWLANKMKDIQEFSFDTETNTLKTHGYNKNFLCVCVTISWGKYNNYYIPLNHRLESNNIPQNTFIKHMQPIFGKEDITLIGHNIKFDLHVITRVGIKVRTKKLFDTMIASWLCDENEDKGLKSCTERIFKVKQGNINEVFNTVPKEVKKEFGLKANQKATFDLVTIENGFKYATDDSYYTWELYLYFLDKLEQEGMVANYYNIYPKFLITLFNMEERGVTVDIDRLKIMQKEMEDDIEDLLYNIYSLAGIKFNPSSSQQLAELLHGYTGSKNPNWDLIKMSFKFPVVSKTKTGAPQTNNASLVKLSNNTYSTKRKKEGIELINLLLDYKKLDKLKTAFVDGMLEQMYDDGKVHPSFNVVGTDSGRISCSSPNLQQLPKARDDDKYQIRSLFIGSNNKKIIAVDYKNLEMVILAHFSQDPHLTNCFINGHDSHGDTAVNMFNLDCTADECKAKYPMQRDVGKTLNFGLMYGMYAKTLCEQLESSGVNMSDPKLLKEYRAKNKIELAQIYMDKYFNSYKGVAQFIRNQKKEGHRKGYVKTLTGRKRRLIGINDEDYAVSSYYERLSVNSCIQGSAGDVTINAQNRLEFNKELEKLDCKMLIQIHDEVVFECPEENCEEALKIIVQLMEHPFGDFGDNTDLNVPLRVSYDVGDSYQDAK